MGDPPASVEVLPDEESIENISVSNPEVRAFFASSSDDGEGAPGPAAVRTVTGGPDAMVVTVPSSANGGAGPLSATAAGGAAGLHGVAASDRDGGGVTPVVVPGGPGCSVRRGWSGRVPGSRKASSARGSVAMVVDRALAGALLMLPPVPRISGERPVSAEWVSARGPPGPSLPRAGRTSFPGRFRNSWPGSSR
ncbi:hypothetical protein I4F81_000774 [Pyropia yezoensis]|uniref:Uncharacterized protein n=1 Tax=Pyropia yezoensis TaxID=2788 RepID=A0ACC3BKL8_PYRYE|nr:hypothetical protein I4F81_000774 [Neopyropia yezoensis]